MSWPWGWVFVRVFSFLKKGLKNQKNTRNMLQTCTGMRPKWHCCTHIVKLAEKQGGTQEEQEATAMEL